MMRSTTKAWLLLLLTAPIPLTLFGVLSYQWYQRQTDSTRMSRRFLQRQNTVIATDAKEVAHQVSALLIEGSRVVRTLPLLKSAPTVWRNFLISLSGPVSQWNRASFSVEHTDLPLFTELSKWDSRGRELVRVNSEGAHLPLRNFDNCDVRSRCELNVLKEMHALPDGVLRIGRLIRWYSPEGMADDNKGASLWFGYRAGGNIFIAALDYRHMQSVLLTNTFPYERRGDPLEGYQSGNYIFVVDSEKNVLVHPKYWHVYGIDRTTGLPKEPFETDEGDGKGPLNIAKYRTGKLRPYFDRLLGQSLRQNTVDVFSAINLKGTNRVVATAPILFHEAQFQDSGIFGYVIAGCNTDDYDAPKEPTSPYY